ncbi:MAG: hypothetical protein KJN76_14110 [Eudoraea sp.]|nr:hypothetical protein [Eudoraea sp.]
MITVRKIKSKYPPNWHWPLEVALLPSDYSNALIRDISSTGWASKLVQTYELNAGRLQCNVLLMKGELNAAIHQLVEFRYSVRADVIVFFCDKPTDYDKLSQKDVDAIRNMVEANGVFFTHGEVNIAYWTDELVFQLSHNNNIITAISKASEVGIFYLSSDLEKSSKLLNYVRKLVHNLKALPDDTGPVILKDGRSMNVQELAYKIQNALPKFKFEHESDEASAIADLSRSISNILPHKLIDIDVEDTTNEILMKSGNVGSGEVYESSGADESTEAEEAAEESMSAGDDGSSGSTSRGVRVLGSDTSHEEEISREEEGDLPIEKEDAKEVIPRYLQCKITDHQGITILNLLETNTSYHLIARIGPSDFQWLQGSRKAPTEKIFKDTTEDQELLIILRTNLTEDIQQDTITLPSQGTSTKASFVLDTFNSEVELIAELSIYHKNRLLQSAVVSAYIVADKEKTKTLPNIRMETLASPRVLLDNLANRTSFASSLKYDAKSSPDKMQLVSSKGISYKLETGLDKMLKNIKAEIEEAVIHIDDYPEDILDENNTPLYINLAHLGRELYDNYLKETVDLDGPVQIISSTHEHIPLEFIYTYPPPAPDAKMCPNSVDALIAGECGGCLDMDEVPAPLICPFGFLCCSKIIERHDINHNSEKIGRGDFATFAEPHSGRQVIEPLKSILFGSAGRVENHSKDLIQKVKDQIKQSSNLVAVVNNWEDWKDTVVKKEPSALVLIVHTENSQVIKHIQQMEIGDKDFLLKTFITEDYIDPASNDPGPLVILIGCNTQENEDRVFDFTNQFKNKGAAVVLSNFTKIRGRHAAPIVEKLFEFLENKKGKEFLFGEIMLKLRQFLFSKGIIVSFSLVAHGDADWKLKI